MTMENLADHIISVAQENDKEITNLQLQKIMYFAIKYARDEKKLSDEELEELYDEPFLVWAYGPVVKKQYDRFKRFGSSPILGVFNSDSSLLVLNGCILENLKKSASELVRKSHEVSFWETNKDAIVGFRSNVQYGLGDI